MMTGKTAIWYAGDEDEEYLGVPPVIYPSLGETQPVGIRKQWLIRPCTFCAQLGHTELRCKVVKNILEADLRLLPQESTR